MWKWSSNCLLYTSKCVQETVLTGGGSLIQGLEELIEEKTGINTMTAEDPLTAVAIGTGKYIEYLADDDKKSKNK